jgi:hypothetical protein
VQHIADIPDWAKEKAFSEVLAAQEGRASAAKVAVLEPSGIYLLIAGLFSLGYSVRRSFT